MLKLSGINLLLILLLLIAPLPIGNLQSVVLILILATSFAIILKKEKINISRDFLEVFMCGGMLILWQTVVFILNPSGIKRLLQVITLLLMLRPSQLDIQLT